MKQLSVLYVIRVANILLINFVNCLPYQTSCKILQSKMILLKENIGTLLKLLVLLLSASVLSEFWDKVLLKVVNLINPISSYHIINLSDFEELYGSAPNYSFLRTFVCACLERNMLSSRSTICVFRGYSEDKKRTSLL